MTRLALVLVCWWQLVAAVTPTHAESPGFLHRPHLHGDAVVFTCEGDLWLGSVTEQRAHRLTTHSGLETAAFFSPDGSKLAFTAEYDGATEIYLMSVEGGVPVRLTYDGNVRTVGWTPDGSSVLYRSARHNVANGYANRLYRVPVAGGPPVVYPIPRLEFAALHRDGRRLAHVPVSGEWQHWKGYRGGSADDIWLADLADGSFRKLTDFPGVDTAPIWVGDSLYFVSERDGVANLYRLDSQTGAAEAATHYTDFGVSYPATDGRRVIVERGDGLALFDPRDGSSRPVPMELQSDRIHARPRRVPVLANLNRVALGPEGKRILIDARGQILSVPADSGGARVLAPFPGSRSQYPAWSSDGKWEAFVSDRSGEEQVWVTPSDGSGEPRRLTLDHQGPLARIEWSPDGKRLAVSDREARILLIEVANGRATLVDQADRAGSYDAASPFYRFSPDGKWLAYTRLDPNWNSAVYLYDVEGKTKTAVSDDAMNGFAPAFDPEGKYLYFLSDREFQPLYCWANRSYVFDRTTCVSVVPLAAATASPFLLKVAEEGAPADSSEDAGSSGKDGKDSGRGVSGRKDGSGGKGGKLPAKLPVVKVDVDGLAARVESVPVPADRYTRIEVVAGRLLLLAQRDQAGAAPDPLPAELCAFDLEKRKISVVVDRLSDFEVSANRKKLLIQKEKTFTVIDAAAEKIPDEAKSVPLEGVLLEIDPPAEWRQMFAEAWRIARDFFYDPGMHGVDWPGVRAKYEVQVAAIADRSDLNRIIGEMMAELNVGHAYIGGGDLPGGPRLAMGYLGADFVPATGSDGTAAYRITKIYPGDGFDLSARSPLLTAGLSIREGTCILAVGGRPVRADEDLQALLVGTAGQITALTVSEHPERDGAREVYVRPLASERAARYSDWVAGRREYVRTHGGENLGYLHIPDMGDAGLQAFAKQYYPHLDKDGMIYDVRNNWGGSISALLLLQMSSPPYAWFKPRYGASWTRQDWGFEGYAAALCNEFSFSNAEEFCDGFQRLKLGPVVGVRTGGGEVGSGNGYALLDGGTIYVPNYGMWAPGDGWAVEGTGVSPDIEVQSDPAAVNAGRDPQLDRAIADLRARLQAKPIVRPRPPAFPKKANLEKGGR
jgi:tricorn protease